MNFNGISVVFAVTLMLMLMTRASAENRTRFPRAAPTKPNPKYLGSKPAKLFNFPWIVSFHREYQSERELIGSGSLISSFYMFGSMDCFLKASRYPLKGKPVRFYQDVAHMWVYTGSIWGEIYYGEDNDAYHWMQKRKVGMIYMFKDDDSYVHVFTFAENQVPQLLNSIRRSPFGFTQAIAVIRVVYGQGISPKRLSLQLPLPERTSDKIKTRLKEEIDKLEVSPFSLECYVTGWRNGDRRLVRYEVVYVPFQQCEIAYCAYTPSACLKWPIKGLHVCFKSQTIDDLCWRDQGSGLYCPAVNESVIAILTTAPTCGYKNLPSVFTLANHGLALFEKVAPKGEVYHPISTADRQRYTPPPQNQLYPAYR